MKHILHGKNPANRNVGGHIDLAFDTHDSQQAAFLDGELEKGYETKMSLMYRFFMNCDLVASLLWNSYKESNVPRNTNLSLFFGLQWNK